MSAFEEALDAWITNPGTRGQEITVYCANESCASFNQPVRVWAQTDYGHTTWEPDGCPDCGYPLEEEPQEVDDEG